MIDQIQQFADWSALFINHQMSLGDSLFSLVLAFILGLAVSLVYRYTHRGFSYEETFKLTLVLITIIVAVIMMTIGSNLALSLGLIGSLSIVRFRTPIKNTIDMAYLFWVIAEGLAVGAGRFDIAILAVIFISIFLFLSERTHSFIKRGERYILTVLTHENCKEQIIKALVMSQTKWNLMSSFTSEAGNKHELNFSIYSRDQKVHQKLEEELNKISSVSRVSLLTPETNLFL